ncbi:unnamed protein product, partial [Meganyctiphanes norvegica]
MIRFTLLVVVAALCGSPTAAAARASGHKSRAGDKPNVVLFLADDMGYGDLGYSGHPTSRTPFIDNLAMNSRFFTHFYVSSPVCSPSRASLLTGRYQVRSGVYPDVFTPDSVYGLPTNETTIAAMLKPQGYKSLAVGKWHLGVGAERQYLPTEHGFDEYFGVPYSQDECPCKICLADEGPCTDPIHSCFPELVSCPLFSNSTIVEQPVDLPTLTQRYVDHAINFIQRTVADGDPFFLYMPFNHVHHPQFASASHEGMNARGLFGDALGELDWAVGQVLRALQDQSQDDNTIVWFASDNGPSLKQHERGGSAGLLRCGKGTTWEGGVRTPAMVRWTGVITPGRSNALVSSMDILPTLAAHTSGDVSALTLDGMDITSIIQDPEVLGPRDFLAVYPEFPDKTQGPFAVIHGKYKGHFWTQGIDLSDPDNFDPMCPSSHPLTKHDPPLLFNLRLDPGERYDLSGEEEYSDEIEMMRTWLAEHISSVEWMESLTKVADPRVQPCCGDANCEPFPECCDCQA